METFFERQLWKIFDFVVGGTRGGPMRLRILEEISRRPRNTNELARIIGIDYKTTEYHLRVLKENSLVTESGSDVAGGVANIDSSRLYNLVMSDSYGSHELELRVSGDVRIYTFTFG